MRVDFSGGHKFQDGSDWVGGKIGGKNPLGLTVLKSHSPRQIKFIYIYK